MNSKKLKHSTRSIAKIAETEAFVALDNPQAAKQVAERIRDAARELQNFPMNR
jgi:plasmid stabilization system protein ParE